MFNGLIILLKETSLHNAFLAIFLERKKTHVVDKISLLKGSCMVSLSQFRWTRSCSTVFLASLFWLLYLHLLYIGKALFTIKDS